MIDNSIVKTKECPDCGYVFIRYRDHMPNAKSEWRKEQKICPTCNKPVFMVEVEHPGESL